MSTGTSSPPESAADAHASLVDALLVYAEPLAQGAHAVLIGDAESGLADRLFELGVRSVQVFDPDPARAANASHDAPPGVTIRALVEDLDVRDGSFNLALVPDIAELNEPHAMIARLRRAVAPSGAIIAMGRAHPVDEADDVPFASDLGLATLDYAAFYELFASEFDEVTIAGVVPFTGVVFAELGGEEDESPPVSVDTRLAPTAAPSVFVVVASQLRGRTARTALDPYAIIQVSQPERLASSPDPTLEADLTAMQLKGELLTAQLEETRERLELADARAAEVLSRLERASLERDAALTRGMELEVVLAASQQTLMTVERRLIEAEEAIGVREGESPAVDPQRMDETPPLGAPTVDITTLVGRAEHAEAALAVALGELSVMQEISERTVSLKNVDLGQLRARAEQAETALSNYSEDVVRGAEALAQEASSYEERLRERAHVISGLEKELLRREHMIRELVASLAESAESQAPKGEVALNGSAFESAAPLSVPSSTREDSERLSRKLDDLSLEVARREGELVARGWRITELESENERLARELGAHASGSRTDGQPERAPVAPELDALEAELARARDELDALRQALTQEHTARLAAESGEELARARSELAHQAALLEQIRGRA